MLVIITQRVTVDVTDNEMSLYTIGSCAISSLPPTVRWMCHWPRATSMWPQSSWCESRQTAPRPAFLEENTIKIRLKKYMNIIKLYLLLTSWRRVLREKLTSSQLVKKFPTFYGTRSFITAFTRTRHLSLSRAISVQSISPIPSHPLQYYLSIYA